MSASVIAAMLLAAVPVPRFADRVPVPQFAPRPAALLDILPSDPFAFPSPESPCPDGVCPVVPGAEPVAACATCPAVQSASRTVPSPQYQRGRFRRR